ncbi:Glycosyl transferase family 2 [Thalassoglobus neptunius]|uniref:Glycosyl transferase family 2 n=1 Tax=Thalassoglobus neptunius TaxID=1938619 RepID=A0A5C5X3M4_9PLAN|nr:glycosyltransferase [Thalassoglobus neptunius]TWT57556.1 Glycosyl transferase family 2 [Thalassoglobus neptunius]
MDETTIIIAQFGRSDLTVNCVQSLIEHHPALAEILIVDDGSRTPEVASLQSAQFENCTILRRPTRSGVTASWNFAARFARGKTLIFLNNDAITTGEWCGELTSPLKDDSCLMTGPEWRPAVDLSIEMREAWKVESLLSGWCFAIQRDVFETLNGFDENLQLYFSDTDLQCRCLDQFGSHAIHAVEDLPLRHLGQQTTRGLATRSQQWNNDRSHFEKKWNCSRSGS